MESLGGRGSSTSQSLSPGDPQQHHGELGREGVVNISLCHQGGGVPLKWLFNLILKNMWQPGGPHCLCIVEGQCSASPVIWVKSYGAGGGAEKLSEEELGTVEERAFGREGEGEHSP